MDDSLCARSNVLLKISSIAIRAYRKGKRSCGVDRSSDLGRPIRYYPVSLQVANRQFVDRRDHRNGGRSAMGRTAVCRSKIAHQLPQTRGLRTEWMLFNPSRQQEQARS